MPDEVCPVQNVCSMAEGISRKPNAKEQTRRIVINSSKQEKEFRDMKKVLGSMSRFIFAGFCIAVLALLMSLTYGALQKLFPGNFANQMWGLVMFDIAAMCWAVAFVFQSKSTIQYAAAGLGFVVAFVGTLGMVAAEVMLSGQNMAQIDTSQIGQWMVYGFIIVTAVHAGLVYAHHAGAPDIAEQINVGVARGEIVTEAINQATHVLDAEKQQLAVTIRNDIISKTKRDLGLIEADPRMPFIPAQNHYEQTVPFPATREAEDKPQSFFSNPRGWWQERFGKKEQTDPQPIEQMAMNSTAERAWQERTDGTRTRIWCKDCKRAGAPWFTEEPCEHILNATPERTVSDREAIRMLQAIWDEEVEPQPAPTSVTNNPTAPVASLPLYNEPTYHPVSMEPRKQKPE